MVLTIFFILGLIVGSFLNVIIYRLRLMDTIMGRSYCPHCKNKIRWYDNIPLFSFILLGAKCRDCGGRISWQYPVVEFLTGIVFVLVAQYFFDLSSAASLWETGFYLIIFSLFVVLMAYDWQYLEMPILIFWIILAIIAVNLGINSYFEFKSGLAIDELNLYSKLAGGFASWLFFFCLVFFSKEKWMGWGDVYVGLLAGLVLGWPAILLGLLLSFLIGSIYSIVLLVLKKGSMKSQVPFIPFLVIGTITSVFVIREFPFILEYIYF